MKVGILQFNPQLRQVQRNQGQADLLLQGVGAGDLDLLVLPELAFTGYNFLSLADIRPFLEPTAAGSSAVWARRTAARLQCAVAVGYPEICHQEDHLNLETKSNVLRDLPQDGGVQSDNSANSFSTERAEQTGPRTYNSLMVVDPQGNLLAHYRKTNLYYTDASWSWPGPGGFPIESVNLPLILFPDSAGRSLGQKDETIHRTPTTFAICMDFNPKQFTAPWDDYELATSIEKNNARLLIASNAWLTYNSREELEAHSADYDASTLTHWILRLKPLLENGGGWSRPGKVDQDMAPDSPERIFVIANRVGIEPGEVKRCDLSKGRPPLEEEEVNGAPSEPQTVLEATVEKAADSTLITESNTTVPSDESVDVPSSVLAEARYAGSSCVFGLRGDGHIRMYGILGQAQEKLLIVNTTHPPAWIGQINIPDINEYL